MSTVLPRPPKVEMDFTDAQLTGFGGWSVLSQMAERLGLPRALSAVSVSRPGYSVLSRGSPSDGASLALESGDGVES